MNVSSYNEKYEKYSISKASQHWNKFKDYIEFPELNNEICLMLLQNETLHKDRTYDIPQQINRLLSYYKRNHFDTIEYDENISYDNIDTFIDSTYYDFIKDYINKTFTLREKYILYSRYGIGCDKKTLEELGSSLYISRERVRQLEIKLLKRLKKYLLNCEEESTSKKT